MSGDPGAIPAPGDQAQRLIDLGLHTRCGLTRSQLHQAAADAPTGTLLAVHHQNLLASALVPLLRRDGKTGFVVEDMTDVDDFHPIATAQPPAAIYLVHDLHRGDEWSNQTPNEALTGILAAGRTPLTMTEGILWLLQQPAALARNHCFMTVGSRRRKPDGTDDARVPALWISNGTGRDGRANRNAPKLGWCWAGNRHTWLGFASGSRRSAATTAEMAC
ncbi:MAG: DUF5701 family protein [Angustibacter sp.]